MLRSPQSTCLRLFAGVLLVELVAEGCTLSARGTGPDGVVQGGAGGVGVVDASAGKGGYVGAGGPTSPQGGAGGSGGPVSGGSGGSAEDGGDGSQGGSSGAAGLAGAAGTGAAGSDASAGAAGNGGTAGSGGSQVKAWRVPITLTPGTADLPADYSVRVDFPHHSLVQLSKSLVSGDDVRVMRWDGSAWSEVDRVADPATPWDSVSTRVYFRLQEAQPASVPNDSFYLYYGPSILGLPKANPQQVYLLWDSFDGTALSTAWTLTPIGNTTASAAVAGGRLRLEAVGGDLWDQADSCAFVHQSLSGGFSADTHVVAFGGDLDGWAKVGGVMLRQSTEADSRNRIQSPVNGDASRTNSYRLQDNQETLEQTTIGANPIPDYARVSRLGDSSRAWYSTDGLTYHELGDAITFAEPLVDPVLVGIPLAPINASPGWVEIEWFRVRRHVSELPEVTPGAEQEAAFPPSDAP